MGRRSAEFFFDDRRAGYIKPDGIVHTRLIFKMDTKISILGDESDRDVIFLPLFYLKVKVVGRLFVLIPAFGNARDAKRFFVIVRKREFPVLIRFELPLVRKADQTPML